MTDVAAPASSTATGAGLVGRASDLGYAAGWQIVRAAPEPLVRRAFDAGADLAARRDGRGVRRLRSNLARVVPEAGPDELQALVRAGVRSYARYWREAFRLPTMDPAEVYRRVDPTVQGLDHLDAALDRGRGAIVALTHSGNWDMVGAWAVGRFGGFTTVAERLKPESLYERFVAYRESLGFEILPMTGGEPPVRGLLRALHAGRIVCLVADRDLSSRGIGVDFFSARATMPGGPASLAAATGAPVLPLGAWFTDGPDGEGWGFRINPPIHVSDRDAIPAATQAMADVFAAEIAEHPADWHMLQRVWAD